MGLKDPMMARKLASGNRAGRQAYGKVVMAFHIANREYHILAKLRRRQIPSGVPAGVRQAVMIAQKRSFNLKGSEV